MRIAKIGLICLATVMAISSITVIMTTDSQIEQSENKSEKSTVIVTTQLTTEVATKKVEETTEEITTSTEKLTDVPAETVHKGTDKKVNNNYTYLLDIDNPDPYYTANAYSLTDSERYEIACVVMGEFGSGGFNGCALIAQAIRDAMQTYGYSANAAISNMRYYGYNSSPNSDSYSAVDFIFSGNAAVQHRILYMNNAPGGWHGTQRYILDYQGVWFYDKW